MRVLAGAGLTPRSVASKDARVLKRIGDRNIWLIYGAVFLLGMAYGISIALTALHLSARGFEKHDIGTLAAWFAGGIVVFSLPMGTFIRRLSAKTTLTVALAGYAVCVAAFPLASTYSEVAAVRFLDGACSVGIWVSVETILLSRTGADNKALITSLYAIALALGYVVGPIAAKAIVAEASMRNAFFVSGAIAITASVLVFVRLDGDVPEMHAVDADGRVALPTPSATLLWRIKTSAFATFAYGYFQASVVLFLPLFLIEKKGIPESQTILLPAFFAGGMLLVSSYAGKLGDRFGHLLVMRVLGAMGMTMVAGFVWLTSFPIMCAAIFIAGGTLASISPLSLALQGKIVEVKDLSRSNAIYNFFYAAGMLLGPPASSAVYERFGGGAMLGHLAALWGGFVAFTIVFYRDDPAGARVAPRHSAVGA